MKISTKGRYGLRVLLDIALYRVGDKPRMIREIAANQEISEKYISRLIIELRKAGFVKSVRGAKGGYTLMRKPEEISILDVLEVMEGPVCIVDCVSASGGECRRTMLCPTRRMWTEINQKIRDIFAGYTLLQRRSRSGLLHLNFRFCGSEFSQISEKSAVLRDAASAGGQILPDHVSFPQVRKFLRSRWRHRISADI